jgi:hypothetical protein
MWLRPWHVIVCVIGLSVVLIVSSLSVGDRAKDILLGLGVNLFSSVVFFVLLELYWQRMKRANGKEVDGFDYLKFARNIRRSKEVRMLSTFIYPFTNDPNHGHERQVLLQSLTESIRQSSFGVIRILFLHPASPPAHSRAAERKDDDVLQRMRESLSTLQALVEEVDGDGLRDRIEIRLFVRNPPFTLFQVDNFSSISFYFRDQPISEVARYEFFMDSPIGVFVEKTFDDLWRDERTIPLTEYLQQTPSSSPQPSSMQTP